MNNKEREILVNSGAKADKVDIVYKKNRWPKEYTKAEKRAERSIIFSFILAGIFALLSFLVFLSPFKKESDNRNNFWHTAYNPLLGLTFGLSLLLLGVGVVLYIKKMVPEEIAIQQRHTTGSEKFDKESLAATVLDAAESSNLPRRKMILRSATFGIGAIGVAAAGTAFGGMIKNPNKNEDLLHSGWTPKSGKKKNETVFLRRYTGNMFEVALVKPEDLDAGAMETVYPWRISDGYGENEESREKLIASMKDVTNPVMLIRLRSNDTAKAKKRKGQESFNYGDYFAYSKICTHLGCPTSLYEQQTNRILCPCHQSQFDALQYGKAIFGPAARALPQLPLTVNHQGYLVAAGDFIEPVGPAFWERKS